MNREVIPIESKEQWLAERAKDIASTDVSALFGLSPYKTVFQLWHEKTAVLDSSFQENESMAWGSALESAIAEKIAEDNHINIKKADYYERLTDLKIGSSYDYMIDSPGEPILEIKNVGEYSFKKFWSQIDDQSYEAPPHIEMQVQHQLMVSGKKQAFIGALIGGNRSILIEREADERIQDKIRHRVKLFWDSVKNNQPPSIDYERDAQTILSMNKEILIDQTYDASGDIEVSDAIRRYHALKLSMAASDTECTKLKALIMHKAHNHKRIECGDLSISLSDVKESSGTLITPEMVGQRYGARKGYRNFRITERKES